MVGQKVGIVVNAPLSNGRGLQTVKRGEMIDSQFMTAREKEKVLKQWISFIENDFRKEKFSTRLYNHLHLHCAFIAHYDKDRFYSTVFVNPQDIIVFLKHFNKEASWVKMLPYVDINSAMVDIADLHRERITNACLKSIKEKELDFALSLLAKHGISYKCLNLKREIKEQQK